MSVEGLDSRIACGKEILRYSSLSPSFSSVLQVSKKRARRVGGRAQAAGLAGGALT